MQTNISATVTETWSSYPYGEEWEQSGPGAEENRFTGHERDGETERHYAGRRYYPAKFGRWIATDPQLGKATSPQTLNRFSYVRNDPTNLIDPDGRQWVLHNCQEQFSEEGGGYGIREHETLVCEAYWEPEPGEFYGEPETQEGGSQSQADPIENQELMFFLQNPLGDCGNLVWGKENWANIARGLRFLDLAKYGGVSLQEIVPGLMYDGDLWGGTAREYFDRDGREKEGLVVVGTGNQWTDVVLLEGNFAQRHPNPLDRQLVYFHEYLHRLYKMGDVDLVSHLRGQGLMGEGSGGSAVGDSSRALQDFIRGGCKKSQ